MRRSGPMVARLVRAGESAASHRSSNAVWTVTRNRSGARPEHACASRAISTSSCRRGCVALVLNPSPTRPASSAIFGPRTPITNGGWGSGARKPGRCQSRRISSMHSSTWARRRRSGAVGRPTASCSRAYRVPGPAPAPSPSIRRPPDTSCSVAAIVASTPGWRFCAFNTSGPSMTSGAATASALNTVQHSRTNGAS